MPNVRGHRAGGIDGCEAEVALIAGSGASPCWADSKFDEFLIFEERKIVFLPYQLRKSIIEAVNNCSVHNNPVHHMNHENSFAKFCAFLFISLIGRIPYVIDKEINKNVINRMGVRRI